MLSGCERVEVVEDVEKEPQNSSRRRCLAKPRSGSAIILGSLRYTAFGASFASFESSIAVEVAR